MAMPCILLLHAGYCTHCCIACLLQSLHIMLTSLLCTRNAPHMLPEEHCTSDHPHPDTWLSICAGAAPDGRPVHLTKLEKMQTRLQSNSKESPPAPDSPSGAFSIAWLSPHAQSTLLQLLQVTQCNGHCLDQLNT